MLAWMLLSAWALVMGLVLFGALRLACRRWYVQPRR
jgi:hypothetical protein